MVHRYLCWILLGFAIVLEICGTATMKIVTLQGGHTGFLYASAFMLISYYALSKAVRRIPLSTAYAMWEGIGLFGTAVTANLLFSEAMTWEKIGAFVIILIGLICIKKGTYTQSAATEVSSVES